MNHPPSLRKSLLWLSGNLLMLVLSGPDSAAQIWVGPKVGLQAARAVADRQERIYGEGFTSSYRPGYTVGLDANYVVNRMFSLETGLLYSRRGKIIAQQSAPYQKNSATYHHVDLPLLLRATFGRGYTQWYLNAGANVSYWLAGGGQLQTDATVVDYRIRFTPNTTQVGDVYLPDANRLQFGLDFGGGLLFMVGPYERFTVDFKYTLGQTTLGRNTAAANPSGHFERVNTATHVVSVSAAYQFKIDTAPAKKRRR